MPARLEIAGDGGARVTFAEPQAGVAPGQACVFYQGTRVLGGGWIAARRWLRTLDAVPRALSTSRVRPMAE